MANTNGNFDRVKSFRRAAKVTGLTYEQVKDAYNRKFVDPDSLTDIEKKSNSIAQSCMMGYKRAAEKAAATVEAPAEVAEQ